MPKRIFITGVGIISAIGNNVLLTLHSLQKAISGIGEITLFDSVYKNIIPVAEVKLSDKQLLKHANIIEPAKYTRSSLLGIIAAREAVQNAGIMQVDDPRTGLISGNIFGGMDKTELFYKNFYQDHSGGRLYQVVNHENADSTEKIATTLGIGGFVTTINTSSSSSANALIMGARLIKNNLADKVIAGGTDAITKFALNGFNSMMILDKDGCKPFDEHRNGITLGEGAAYLVLESEESVERSGKNVLAELTGYGNTCSKPILIGKTGDVSSKSISMKKAMEMSRTLPDEIDYINVHGSGSRNNDLTEGKALEEVFGSNVPPFSSTKSYTGHALGAAAAIEAVFSVLAINHGIIYPNLNFRQPMKEIDCKPVNHIRTHVNVRHVLSNSFASGGSNTSLIFSKV